MTRDLPSPAFLRKLLRYEPDTGKLFWRERPAEMFRGQSSAKTWNKRFAGREAFTAVTSEGYLHGSVFSIRYYAHRVIWAMQTGAWPVDQIDHANGVRNDNKFLNLGEADNAENGMNRAITGRNTSGVIGVHWHAPSGKWLAKIRHAGVSLHLGVFDALEDAAAARKDAELRYGFHENHGRS